VSSTAAKRLEQFRFYLDESIYSRVLRDRMRECGAHVEHAGGAFPFGTPDEIWLTACGKRNWIVLTRDQRIRRRVLEREAIRQSSAAVFALTAGQATAAETAEVITRLLAKFLNMTVSEPRPFLYTFGLSGRLSRVRLVR
jgi:hypothetical protein